MRKTLSIAMIAMNEEANLPRTLESVRWADEIVLVDSGSKAVSYTHLDVYKRQPP